MRRLGAVLLMAMGAAVAACQDPPPAHRKPEKAEKAAEKLAAQPVAAPVTPTAGLLFSPEPERPEAMEPAAYMLDYCQSPAGGRNRAPVPLAGAFPRPIRTTLFYRDTATLLQPAFRCVIRDEDDWTEISVLGRLVVDKTVLLNFRREMILLAGTGAKTSGGFDVRFDSITIRRDTMWVFVGNSAPPPGAVLAAEAFSAAEVRRVPRFEGTVVFVEETIPPPPPLQPLKRAPKDTLNLRHISKDSLKKL
ncbi:hypothetical protein [Longimicrobium sp.]|uniref:hypothetical protein n=1 Tax=Longimicrobium sp. TaxID=2029185 RepID=UPI002BE06F35|nr:hypothetical protein [Longimicrobium sp.]HSU16957.1 hypothetical protein [Longimicrobium sp.]